MTRLFRTTLTLLLAAAAVALAAGCGGSSSSSTAPTTASGSAGSSTAGGAEKPSLTLGLQEPWSALPVYVAMQEGMFAEHGIGTVKVLPFTSVPAMLTAVTKGQIDAVLQTPITEQAFNAKTSGPQLRMFAPAQEMALVWLAADGSGVPKATPSDWQSTVKAFRGKKIGVAALGAITDLMTRYMAEQAGLDPAKDFSITAVAPGAGQVASMKNGTLDVTTGDVFGAVSLEQAGGGYPALDTRTTGPENLRGVLLSGYLASQDQLSNDPQAYSGFAAALSDARAFMADPANKDAVVKAAVEGMKLDPKLAAALYPTIDTFQLDLDKQLLDRSVKAFVQAGLMPAPAPSYSQLAWEGGS